MFTTDDIEAPNNTVANETATNAKNNAFGEKKLLLKIMLHLSIVFQKLMAQKLIMQKI